MTKKKVMRENQEIEKREGENQEDGRKWKYTHRGELIKINEIEN